MRLQHSASASQIALRALQAPPFEDPPLEDDPVEPEDAPLEPEVPLLEPDEVLLDVELLPPPASSLNTTSGTELHAATSDRPRTLASRRIPRW